MDRQNYQKCLKQINNLGSMYLLITRIHHKHTDCCSYLLDRNWRYEQEIAGLLWKIHIDEIQGLNQSIYDSKVCCRVDIYTCFINFDVIIFTTQLIV